MRNISLALAALTSSTAGCRSEPSATGTTASSLQDAPAKPDVSGARNVNKTDDVVAKNKATLASINVDTLPRWTPALQRQRFIAEVDARYAADMPCPQEDVVRARSAKDEFEKHQKDDDLTKARQGCVDKLRTTLGPLPELAVLELGLQALPYDFANHRYTLTSAEGSLGEREGSDDDSPRFQDWFVGALPSPGLLVVGVGSQPTTETCDPYLDGQRVPALGLLVIADVHGPSLGAARELPWPYQMIGERWDALAIPLTMDESAARAMKPRLHADYLVRSAKGKRKDMAEFLRLQLVFRPGGYKAYGWCGRHAALERKAWVGTGVGYRLLDKQGVLIDWTPVGPAT
jgi:hypothetical protein